MSSSDKTPRDLYKEVTTRIIKAMQAHTVPWQRPWTKLAELGLPRSAVSSNSYNGINAALLFIHAQEQGYADNRWCTFKQANEAGWRVRKGERSTPIYFFKMLEASEDETEETSTSSTVEPRRPRPMLREYRVFNAQQIDGVPEAQHLERTWEPVAAVEEVVRRLGVEVRHGGNRAFYRVREDFIQMPNQGAFPDASAYSGTLLHEVGHKVIFDLIRQRERAPKEQHGIVAPNGSLANDDVRAWHELRAEWTSAMMSAELGVPTSADDHAAYLDSWLKLLREDKYAIFRAARDARQVCDCIAGRLPNPAAPSAGEAPNEAPSPSPDAKALVAASLARAKTAAKRGASARRKGLLSAAEVIANSVRHGIESPQL